MLRTSISPNQFTGGYRLNVIPSEAKALLDVRMLPDEDPAKFLEQAKKIVNDSAVEVACAARDVRPGTAVAKLDSEAYKVLEANVSKTYKAPAIPTMSTGATDMAYLRGKGIRCYGIGPATDVEDGPLGFGAHSDQERLLESKILRFAHFNWDVITDLARARELEASGDIGLAAPSHYSFIGYTCQPERLLDESVPAIIGKLREETVDVVVLVPV